MYTGEEGEIYSTGFLNYDQPLIRYRIGDRKLASDQITMCGRSMMVIDEIAGRVEDIIHGPTVTNGTLWNIFKYQRTNFGADY